MEGRLSERRRRLFSGASFSTALFFSGAIGGESESFRYFSGCSVDGCCLVLRKNGGVVLAYEMNYKAARAASHYSVRLLGPDATKALRKACGRGKVGFSSAEMSAARYLALKKRAKLKLVDAYEKIGAVRGRKSREEAAAIAAAAKITRRILEGLDPWKHRTEAGLCAHLKIRALEESCALSYEPIVATGANSRFPHHTPGNAKLADIVLVDFGVKKDGYCSDFTRCYFRKKGTKEEKAYLACKEIFGELAARLPECRNGRDVALLSEKLLAKHKLPAPIHSIGHGVGLEVHDYPHLGRKSTDSLEGAVLALEPAAYFKSFGVRFEGMVANTKGGWKLI
ncbi:Xaa-Pro dipeptidase [uncultured archaeon]|nr:Xaa-Pro dipeptidase [uncultured archaeon]